MEDATETKSGTKIALRGEDDARRSNTRIAAEKARDITLDGEKVELASRKSP